MRETRFAPVRVPRTKSSECFIHVFISPLPSTSLLMPDRGTTVPTPTVTHTWFLIHAESAALARARDLDQLITLSSISVVSHMGLCITARNRRTQGQVPADYAAQDLQNADTRLAGTTPTRTGLCKLRSG